MIPSPNCNIIRCINNENKKCVGFVPTMKITIDSIECKYYITKEEEERLRKSVARNIYK